MKLLTILILFLSFFFSSFGRYEKENDKSPDSLFVAKPTRGRGKEVSAYILSKDSVNSTVFFEDSIAGIACALYKPCESGASMTPPAKDTPKLYRQYGTAIDTERMVLFINGKFQPLKKCEEGVTYFDPQNIGYFEFKGDRYLYINLSTPSKEDDNACRMVLVKLHGNKVVDTYVISSQNQLGSGNFGERKGDASLDYYTESQYFYSNKTRVRYVEVYSLQNSKLLYSNSKTDTVSADEEGN